MSIGCLKAKMLREGAKKCAVQGAEELEVLPFMVNRLF